MSSPSPTSSKDSERHETKHSGSPGWTDVEAAAIQALHRLQEQRQHPGDRHTPLSVADIQLLSRLQDELNEVRPSQEMPREVDQAAVALLLAIIARLQRDDDDLLVMNWKVRGYRSPSAAARSGFYRGLMDSISLDFFGDEEFLQARHLIAHRDDALGRDWSHVAKDWRNALAQIYELLRQELKDLNERQGTLFSPADLEESIERH